LHVRLSASYGRLGGRSLYLGLEVVITDLPVSEACEPECPIGRRRL